MIDDPWTMFAAWMSEASAHEPRVPDAMQVATATPDGLPFVRTVLLKDFGPDGLTFYTNLESRKGRQLLLNPQVAFVLHFKSLERQILGEGRVSQVGDLTADAYFATRPRGSQIGAWASPQSREIPDRDVLVARVAEFEAKFEGGPVPRPPHWSGFRITPARMEFWQGHDDRLHDRRSFAWQGNGWVPALLAP